MASQEKNKEEEGRNIIDPTKEELVNVKRLAPLDTPIITSLQSIIGGHPPFHKLGLGQFSQTNSKPIAILDVFVLYKNRNK